MAATGLYFLNGLDMYTAYGFAPAKGCSDDILRPRKAKAKYSNNWEEDDGEEYDLSAPVKYEDREIRLKGYIVAVSESDFWAKYNSLKLVFTNTGTNLLRCAEFGANATVAVFYKDTPTFTRLTRLKNTNRVFCEIEILLQEAQQTTG